MDSDGTGRDMMSVHQRSMTLWIYHTVYRYKITFVMNEIERMMFDWTYIILVYDILTRHEGYDEEWTMLCNFHCDYLTCFIM